MRDSPPRPWRYKLQRKRHAEGIDGPVAACDRGQLPYKRSQINVARGGKRPFAAVANNLPEIPHSAYEISGSPLQPYAAETFQKEAKTQALTLREARQKAALDAAAAQEERLEIVSKLEASEISVNELNKHLTHITTLANDLLGSKWWRMTRHLRRWSNSLRKHRGRPKKRWPDQVDLSAVSLRLQATAAGEYLWKTYTPVAGVVSPFGRSNADSSIPVVPYSTIKEDFVEYVDHDPIESLVRAIAFYLPQFHPFAQNDEWWGKGFTEWTNVGKARPLFPGHHQPHCPIHLGYYDLRIPQIMQEQARLARNYGISGFAYYFYWFAGQLLMETPLEAMLADPGVDLPFCMIWANENWTRRWDGQDQELLIAQDYSLEDSRAMLGYLQKFMEDKRYIRVNGKPLFIIYRATIIPDFVETLSMWRSEAKRMGLGDLYIVSAQTLGHMDPKELGLDAAIEFPPHGISPREMSALIPGLLKDFSGGIHEYPEVVSNAVRQADQDYMLFRTTMLSWDNTARLNLKASIFTDFSLTRYSQWLASNMERAAKDPGRSDSERLVFINAWNEWAEGAHLEPDQKHGFGYLEATRSVIENYSKDAEVFMRPAIPDTTAARFAVVAHLHYGDTWPELRNAIATLNDVDIYVTVTNVDLAQTIAADMPSAIVELVDNRGRDVRPFLLTMQRIFHLGYRAVCKVHGKKSVHRADGDSLRQQLFATLINAELMTQFDENKRLGFLATASSMVAHDYGTMRDNQKLVDEISLEMGVPFVKDQFAAGTMFWVDPRAIEPILKLRINDFDIERGLADGTRAHAIERLFCVVCEAKGFEVGTVGEARRDLGISVAHRNQTPSREVTQSVSDARLDQWHARLMAHAGGAIDPDLPPLPPLSIQEQFVGSSRQPAFEEAFAFYKVLIDKSNSLGLPLNHDDTRFLDFGCGWGRFLRYSMNDVPRDRLFGTDIDPEIIELCRSNGIPAQYRITEPLGTLPFEDGYFSHVMAYSVFTHLPESVHLNWSAEIARVLRPGGLFFGTIETRKFLEFIQKQTDVELTNDWQREISRYRPDAARLLKEYDAGKFVYLPTGGGGVRTSDVYGEAVIPPAYIKKHWNGMCLLAVIDESFWQTVIILQKIRD